LSLDGEFQAVYSIKAAVGAAAGQPNPSDNTGLITPVGVVAKQIQLIL